ncbi:TonB-dependent receptor [Alteromonas sp. 1_MG-2023]|uniref:TonB-dependent receptor n=1 Tax=Alteromonas sp. 1_MG-2023 TaxID=3062669 RepID=UPI0026E126C5|nr:TonB-dependent receptor plug domain-containing protein [Alteromonas sp. 1_MG-2023]MDO6475187.1 TonB-dependent receptor [Alteromonas sp. 1_MG-2023]
MENKQAITGITPGNQTTLLLLLSMATLPAIAQTEAASTDNAALEKIVVSARKKEETIQESPLSIQAFNSGQLEARGINDVAELTQFTPGVTFNSGSSRANSDFAIRGMAQTTALGDNRRDLVTVFVDGIPILGSPAGISTNDLQRVEVIKGPQSALFGRATFGGAISMITTTPQDELTGHIKIGAGTYGERSIEGAVEGGLIEDILTGRVTYSKREFDGFYENSEGGRLGETSQQYYSATLNFTPAENFSLKMRYSNNNDEDGEAATQMVAQYTDFNCGPFITPTPRFMGGLPEGMTLTQASSFYCGEIKASAGTPGVNTENLDSTLASLPVDKHGLWLDKTLFSATAEWLINDNYTATFLFSDQEHEIEALTDFDRTTVDTYQAYTMNRQTQNTYELRIESGYNGPFNWMLGLSRLDFDFGTGGGFINGAWFGAGAGGPWGTLDLTMDKTVTDAVFGSLAWQITDAVDVSVEMRRQFDEITSGVGSVSEYSIKTPATLPRVLARWAIDKSNNVYFNYAQGNQPTQGYSVFFELDEAQQQVARENGINESAPEAKVDNLELGWKHYSEDGRWYLNSAVYFLKWRDRQTQRGIQVDLNGDGVIDTQAAPLGEVFNAVPMVSGDSETTGVELDGAYALTPDTTIGGTMAYANTDVTKALSDDAMLSVYGEDDAAGQEYPLVPKLSATAYIQTYGSFAGNYKWQARADATYTGKRYTDMSNIACLPARTLVNLRAGISVNDWDLSAYVTNLFNDDTPTWARSTGDSATDPYLFSVSAVTISLATKRQVGATLSYRF